MGFTDKELKDLIMRMKIAKVKIVWDFETFRCDYLEFGGLMLRFTQKEKDMIMQISPLLWDSVIVH